MSFHKFPGDPKRARPDVDFQEPLPKRAVRPEVDIISSLETSLDSLRSEMARWRETPEPSLLSIIDNKVDRLQDEADRFEGCVAWRKSFNNRLSLIAAEVDDALRIDPRRIIAVPAHSLQVILELVRRGRRTRDEQLLESVERRLNKLLM